MYKVLKHKIEENELTHRKVAESLGVNPSTITKFLNGRHELKFELLFKLITDLFVLNEQKEAFKFFFTHLTIKQNIMCALEFFAASRYWESLEMFILKIKANSTGVIQELIYLYELQLKLKKREHIEAVFKEVTVMKPKSPEGKAVHSTLLLDCYGDFQMFKHQKLGKSKAESIIDVLPDSYFKRSLINRKDEIYLFYYGQNYDLKELNNLLNVMESRNMNHYSTGTCLHWRALFHFWTNYEKSLEKFKLCIEFFKQTGAKKHYYFSKYEGLYLLMIYYGKQDLINDIDNAPPYIQSLYYVKKGNKNKSRDLLEKSKRVTKKQGDTSTQPYEYYLEGLLTGNFNYLWQSVYCFFREGDIIFSNLPFSELKKNACLPTSVYESIINEERSKKLFTVLSPSLD